MAWHLSKLTVAGASTTYESIAQEKGAIKSGTSAVIQDGILRAKIHLAWKFAKRMRRSPLAAINGPLAESALSVLNDRNPVAVVLHRNGGSGVGQRQHPTSTLLVRNGILLRSIRYVWTFQALQNEPS